MFYIDGHCDTLSKALDEGKDLYQNNLQFSIEEANKLGGGIQTMAAFVDTEYLVSEMSGFDRCSAILGKFWEFQNSNSNILIRNKIDVQNAEREHDTKVLLSIENGAAISGNLSNVDYFYENGVRMMSITWNHDNELGCGAKTKNDVGLSMLGCGFVERLNNLGVVIDVSHSSEKTFWDVISMSDKPVVASHSNVFELCNNNRNLKDAQIKAIAKSGGIIGICFYGEFLKSEGNANVADIVEHIKYIKKLVGVEYVGLGSDFDGMNVNETAKGVENITKLDNIITELKLQCFSDDEIVKIMWNNWSCVLKRILR